MKPIDVMLCVNDHRNGAFCGKLSGVDISDFMKIECAVIPECGCSFGDYYFSVHRTKFKLLSHSLWVGNWCWDSVRMEPIEAARFIAHLLSQHPKPDGGEQYNLWCIECAEGGAAIALADRHRNFEPINADEVLTAMQIEGVAV